MMNFEKATPSRREETPGPEPRRPERDAVEPSRSVAPRPIVGAADLLGGAYGASWRESREILFALRLGPDGLVFDAINSTCEKSLRLANAAVVGRSPTEVLPPSVAGPFLLGCLQCAASGRANRFTHAMALERRRRRWDTTLTPVCDQAGAVFLILGRSHEVAASSGALRAEPGARRAATLEGPAAQAAANALTINRDWRITAVTAGAADWMGLPPRDIVGRDARKTLLFSGAMHGAVDAALTIGLASRLQLRSMFRPGSWLDLQVAASEVGATIAFRDVTSEAAALEAAQAASLIDYGTGGDPVEMALLDAGGVILAVNAAWRETFGALHGDGGGCGVGAAYEDICLRIIPDLDPAALREAIRQLLAREAHTLTHAYVVVTAAGPRWRQIRVLPLKDDLAHFVAVHEDLTEVARDQAAQRRTSEQLLSARQEERERIAVDLHDSTSQHLTTLGVGLARLRRLMGASAAAQGILDDMASSIHEAAKEIRVMSYLMKPPSLHRDGLEATARRYVKGFGIRTGLAAVFRCEGALTASAVIQHAAFRVVQEALSNVHRHARASGVEVELAVRDGELTLRIADDGAGIAPLRRARLEGIPPGVGIAGMRSRVEHLGGRFDVASSAAGTVVTARIPLPETARPRTARQ